MNKLKKYIKAKFENFIKKQYQKIAIRETFKLNEAVYSMRHGKRRNRFSYCFFENEQQELKLWFKYRDNELIFDIEHKNK